MGSRTTAAGSPSEANPPQYVKPYVKGNKNDMNDAQAICKAVGRPNMRFVSIKTVDQQDMQAIHRIRSELVKQRTAKGNQISGLVLALAPRRYPKFDSVNPVSKTSSGTVCILTPTIRSITTGMPSFLVFVVPGFGISTRLAGWKR
ncbi:MAG: transposase [Betaproteobacteria bacterium]|nr:transposase [Betaproteobacteria bacterium]